MQPPNGKVKGKKPDGKEAMPDGKQSAIDHFVKNCKAIKGTSDTLH